MSGLLSKLLSLEAFRFFTVAAIGLVIDIAVGSFTILVLGFADIPASAVGLFSGMLFNYFMHLRWTFDTTGEASLGHFATFAVAVALTLILRAAVLWTIEVSGWQDSLAPPIRLFIGAAIGFLLSYIINRNFVFKNTSQGN